MTREDLIEKGLKIFEVHVYTEWCGEDFDYYIIAPDEFNDELIDIAENLAYDNYYSYEHYPEDFGYDSEEELELAIEEGNFDDTAYYGYTISEVEDPDNIEELLSQGEDFFEAIIYK